MPWRLKEVIPEALKRAGGKERLKRGMVLAFWKEVAGPGLARFTEAVALEEGTLVVVVPDPVAAHQLTYARLALLKRYEERFPGMVREIRFQVGRVEPPPPEPVPEDKEKALEASRKALLLAEAAPPALKERVARAARALFLHQRGSPCPICEAPSPTHPCPTCRRLLQDPAVRKEAERLYRGRPSRLSGEPLAAARHLAREKLLTEMRELYPEALREPSLIPLLKDLAQRFQKLFPQEALPEGVRSLLSREG
nr:DciA family protein [Thermus composti]